jgi:hypothetical protein
MPGESTPRATSVRVYTVAVRARRRNPLLVHPVTRGPLPPPAGAPVPFDDLGPCRAISPLGLPAVAVRGIQIVARRGHDEDALAAAALL